jgi:hypothetical protein
MYLTVIKTFLTAKSSWIKYAAIAILTVMVLAYAYGAGKDSERAEWLGKEREFISRQNAIKDAAKKRIEENQAKYDEILMGVINEHNKSIEERDNRIADLNSRGLHISSKNCSGGNRLPTKTKNASQLDSAAAGGEIRLSESTTRGLAEVAADANEVVKKYNRLARACSPLVEVIE